MIGLTRAAQDGLPADLGSHPGERKMGMPALDALEWRPITWLPHPGPKLVKGDGLARLIRCSELRELVCQCGCGL